MRKIISLIVVATMLVSILAIQSNAAMNIGFVPVLYADADTITIDGTVGAAEWDETNSLNLKVGDNMKGWAGDFDGEIQFFYSWGDDGLYLAAKVIDSTFNPAELDATSNDGWTIKESNRDRFQLAFNPMGLIYDNAQGLFFSFIPVFSSANGESADTIAAGKLTCYKHNWAQNQDEQIAVVDASYQGAFVRTADGWDMEAVLPWNVIASTERTWDIVDMETDFPFLQDFNPKNEDRTLAFTEAMIAYVDVTSTEGSGTLTTARTATSAEIAAKDIWTVDVYDIVLKFFQKGEDPTAEGADKVTYRTIEDLKTLYPDAFEEEEDETDNDATQAPEGEDDETDAETDASSKAPATNNNNNGGDKTNDDAKGGMPIWLIVVIVVAVVAVAAVVVVVIKKKK